VAKPNRPTKRRVEGSGRVTPKGGPTKAEPDTSTVDPKANPPKGTAARAAARSSKRTTTPEASGRYTPRVPSYQKTSGPIVPILMFTFWGLGIAMIMFNYLQFLPGAVSNWYVFGGLGLILAGIVTATQYR